MVFSSMVFLWIFLPLSIGSFFLLKEKYQNVFLFIISLVFYAWGEPQTVIILLFSIFINYFLVLFMDKFTRMRKYIFAFILCFNIGVLFYYKYLYFVLNDILKMEGVVNKNLLPIGISFYSFSILSYAIEIYNKNEKIIENILDFGLYISFFPKLVQGPIVKYTDFAPQLYNRVVTVEKIYYGINRFIIGLGKKVLIANILGEVVDEIFNLSNSQLSTGVAWLGALSYTVQIYYDFSGYSDMAIGLGKIFGFDFKENFNYPYMAASIKDFWRRWHISLSTWFRDYIYIPLGGNRSGRGKTYINTLIVFIITGIWHGANWTFWFWGIYHGIINIVETCFLGKYLKKLKMINVLYTNLIVTLGWVVFRADNMKYALVFIKNMFTIKTSIPNVSVNNYLNGKVLTALLAGIFFSGIIQIVINKMQKYIKISYVFVEIVKGVLLMGILFLSIMSLASGTYNPFIYFKF